MSPAKLSKVSGTTRTESRSCEQCGLFRRTAEDVTAYNHRHPETLHPNQRDLTPLFSRFGEPTGDKTPQLKLNLCQIQPFRRKKKRKLLATVIMTAIVNGYAYLI
jgi:hypothetical protein